MRALLGFLAFNGLLIGLGLALAFAVGLVRPHPRALVTALGAGLLLGAAAAGAVTFAALAIGLGLDVKTWGPAAAVAIALLVAVGRRRHPHGAHAEGILRREWVLAAGVFALYVAAQALRVHGIGVAWDAAHNWYLKATFLANERTLSGALFSNAGAFDTSHLDYPLVQPALAAMLFRFTAQSSQTLVVIELWLLVGAAVLAAAPLAGCGERSWIAIVPFAVAFAAPLLGGDILRGDADALMAGFLGAGALAIGSWLERGPPAPLIAGAVLLAGAAGTKNEGLAFGICVLAAALGVTLVTDRRRALAVLAAGAGVLLLIAPWRIWLHQHGPYATDVTPLSVSLNVHFLSDQVPLLDFGARELLAKLIDPSFYGLVAPVAIAVCLAVLVAGPLRRLAAFHLASILLAAFALLWIYWTSTGADAYGHVARTSLRTGLGPLFLAAAALGNLLPRLLPAHGGTSAPSPTRGGATEPASRAGDPVGAVVSE